MMPAPEETKPPLFTDWFLGAILFLGVALAYQPVLNAGFVWDDDGYVSISPHVFGPRGLLSIWTTRAADISPFTESTFWVEKQLWGRVPLPYHLVNFAIHGACAVLLWRVLLALRVPGAWLGAALWALHPVQVESVAWISEMKNTESGLFFLLSILFFVKWLRVGKSAEPTGSNPHYALSLIFAALAMASKSSTVILPVVLWLCAWWMEGRWDWRNLVRVAPLIGMAAVACAVSIWTQHLHLVESAAAEWTRSWPQRFAAAGDAVWFYLGKLLWPHPLIATYPRWQIDAGQLTSYLPLLAVIVVLAVLWLKCESWGRPWFFLFAYFLVALLPVLGLADNPIFHYSLVFDHFQYLASMGPLALAGAGLARLVDLTSPPRRWVPITLCAGLLAALGLLSWARSWVYESQETLWIDTLAKNPTSWAAQNNVGNIYFQHGRLDDALAQYEKALQLNPAYTDGVDNIGDVYLKQGQIGKAIDQYHLALGMNHAYAKTYYDLGNALLQKGQTDDAMAQYRQALQIDPEMALARNNLGNALLHQGQVDGAIDQYRQALETNPELAEVRINLVKALLKKGAVDEAITEAEKMDQSDSATAQVLTDLGDALLARHRLDDAMALYVNALKIDPDIAEAHNNLGIVLIQKGLISDATAQFQEAVRLKPDDKSMQTNLARAQAMLAQPAK